MTYCEGIQINKLDKYSPEYISGTNLTAACFLHSSYKYNICHGDLHPGNILVKPNGNIVLLDYGICYKGNMDERNKLLYVYRKSLFDLDYNSINELFKHILVDFKKLNYNELIFIFIKYISMKQVLKNNNKEDLFFFTTLVNFCKENNIIIKGDSIHMILQVILLDSFAYAYGHNGSILLRTLSYMKTEEFFMNEMEEYILDFYNIESNNETNLRVKNKYQ